MKALTKEQWIEKAKAVHGDKYDYSLVEYVNIKTPVKIICKKHGPFMQTPRDHYSNHGCPLCGGNKKSSTENFIEKAKKVHGDTYDYSKVDYKNNKTPVEIICKEHGSFMQTPDKHVNSGHGCPLCAKNHNTNTVEFIEKARQVHGDFYDYSKTVYVKNSEKVCIIDPEYGEFWQTPNAHLGGEGCPLRKFDKIRQTSLEKYGVDNYTKTAEYAKKSKQTCLERYGTEYSLQSEYVRAKSQDTIVKKYGCDNVMHVRGIKSRMLDSKRHNKSFNTSACEEIAYKELVRVFGKDDIVRQYSSDEYPFMCDFYVVSRNLYIELNASWTHGKHWFNDNDSTDLHKIEVYTQRNTDYYKNAINVWTVSDVAKRNTAKENNLNYVVFWMNNLWDFYLWLGLDCPDGTDWNSMYSWLPDRVLYNCYIAPEVISVNHVSDVMRCFQFDVYYKGELALWRNKSYYRDFDIKGYLYANRYNYIHKLPDALSVMEIVRGFKIAGIHRGYTLFDNRLFSSVLRDYEINSVYDPCAGWGERLLTCYVNNVSYFGIDINKTLVPGYEQMVSQYNMTCQHMEYGDGSKYIPDFEYDAVITCPPYHNIEIYSDEGAENLSFDDFKLWWNSVVTCATIKKPRYFCFQINTKYRDWMADVVAEHEYTLIDELFYDNNKSSHFTRRARINLKKSVESMLIFERK